MKPSEIEGLFRLDGRLALVTGAGHALGSDIAGGLAAAGANILVVDKGDLAEAAAKQIREESGHQAEVVPCDLTNRTDISAAIDQITRMAGRIDILVNAFYESGPEYTAHVLDTDVAGWDLCWTGNVISQVRFCQAVGRQMLRNGDGRIINLLSTVSFSPYVGLAPYGASKAACWMFTRSLALECAPTVRVHGLATGSLDEVRDNASRQPTDFIPLDRYGGVGEVVGAAIYLASDAASFSTGDVVFVDGGVAALSRYPTANRPELRG